MPVRSSFRYSKPAGSTLLETVVGMFIITVAAIGAARMLEAGGDYGGFACDQIMARTIAEAKIRELRYLASTQAADGKYGYHAAWPGGLQVAEGVDGNQKFGVGPASVVPATETSGIDPRFTVEWRPWRFRLYSPARNFPHPVVPPGSADRSIAMDSSMCMVEVTVRWGGESRRARQVALFGWIGDPLRPVKSLSMLNKPGTSGPPSTSLAPSAGETYTLVATDAWSNPIGDALFRFYLAPISGNGTLTQTGGTTVALRNQVKYRDGSVHLAPGTASLTARTSGAGREYWQAWTVTFQASP